MGQVRVISDLHFGHINLAIARGFDSVEEHDQHIIDQWNGVVLKRDVIWILGDIVMEKVVQYEKINLLKGIKKVVMGNHDKNGEYILPYVNGVWGMVKYKGFWLTHCPIHPHELRGLKNIHGHVHSSSIEDDRYINVCCEQIDYKPILISDIR